MLDGPADVGGEEVEGPVGGRGELADEQIAAHGHHRHVGAGDEVGQLVGEGVEVAVARLELLVDGGQLLVGRLQLLFGGLELLVGALQLFVARQHLFVRRPQFLIGRDVTVDDGLEVMLGGRQFLAQPIGVAVGDAVVGAAGRHGPAGGAGRLEQHQQPEVSELPHVHRQDAQRELDPLAAVEDVQAFARHRRAAGLGLGQGTAQFHQQALLDHAQQVGRRLPGRRFKKGRRLAAELLDLEVLVDEHARRRIAAEQEPIGRPVEVGQRLGRADAGPRRDPGQPGAGSEGQGRPLRAFLLAEDAARRVHGFEQVAETADRFGDAEHQEAGAIQGEVEDREQPFLERRRHVDHDVAAGHQVDARERRIDRQVLAREDAQVADALLDAVVAVLLDEELAEALGADLGLDALGIDAGAGPIERARVAQVGGEDLDLALRSDALQVFEQGDGDRIGFLARGATRRPGADRLVVGGCGHERRQHVLLERIEHLRLPEEAGDVDEHVAIQRLGLGLVARHQLRILAGRTDAVQQHAPRRAPLDGGVAVVAEVHARTRAQRGDDLLELGVLVDEVERDGSSDIGVLGELRQLGPDLGRGQHQVDGATGHGAPRHGLMFGRVVLREGDPARGLHLTEAERAVGPGARQDDGSAQGALHRHQRAQEVVDGVIRTGLARTGCDRQDSVGNGHDGIGLDHEDRVGGDFAAVDGLHDVHAAMPLEQRRQVALSVRAEMLDDDYGQSWVRRQSGQQLGERLQAARGRADPDDRKRIVGTLGHAREPGGRERRTVYASVDFCEPRSGAAQVHEARKGAVPSGREMQ